MGRHTNFDATYYDRFYLDPKTRAMGAEDFRVLGDFVCSYVRYLGQPVKRVLDLGCSANPADITSRDA